MSVAVPSRACALGLQREVAVGGEPDRVVVGLRRAGRHGLGAVQRADRVELDAHVRGGGRLGEDGFEVEELATSEHAQRDGCVGGPYCQS